MFDRHRLAARIPSHASLAAFLVLASSAAAGAADWTDWRGPNLDGSSEETGLVSSWTPGGEHQIWHQGFTGRATPIVLGGRVFVTGRAGDEATQRELIAAFDARTGDKIWEHHISTALTSVPFNRVGWASPVADRETGYVYVQGVAGPLICYDRDGNVVWQHHLYQEFGRYSGYGGRTHTPMIDGDQLLVSVINSSWGKLGAPRHRYFSFDKKTGDVLWISTPGGAVNDLNVQSNGTVAVIGGQRLFIVGNADGNVYALNAHTGEKVWEFHLSKVGLNSTPVVVGDLVVVGHSEENLDDASQGRVVAIDATGKGDVTATHEKWRRAISMGFPTAMVHAGRVYVMDNSANLSALDLATGETRWEITLGTVGKSMPVWADGKIYVTEVNGRLHILEPGNDSVKELDDDQIHMPEGRYAELYGSPAIAYGRVYLSTEEGLYCLGDPQRSFQVSPSPERTLAAEAAGGKDATLLQVVPADVTVGTGDTVQFHVRSFNDNGRPLGETEAEWSVAGLQASFSQPGKLRFGAAVNQAGEVVAKHGGLEARGRVRAFTPLPFSESFDDAGDRGRPWWIGAGRYQVSELDGNKVLEKPVAPSGLLRSALLLGPADLTGYTMVADVRASQKGRRRSDIGLINSGYILELHGVRQELEIKTWEAMRRVAVTEPFSFDMDTWYRLKLRVERDGEHAVVLGKVWKKGESEPEAWNIRTEDTLAPAGGAPGVIAYSPASAYFDNIQVVVNE